MTNLIRTLSGLTIICSKTGFRRGDCYPVSMRHPNKYAIQGGECPVDVYMDGALVSDNGLEKMRVKEFGAVEYHSGGPTIPVQYNRTGSSCGVLPVWARER